LLEQENKTRDKKAMIIFFVFIYIFFVTSPRPSDTPLHRIGKRGEAKFFPREIQFL
jgi:hypothetical protein